MSQLPISRRRILTAGAAGTLGILLTPEAAFAKNTKEVKLLRWDLVEITSGVVLAGGTDVARDARTGETIHLTGSGQAEPKDHSATGGGTFIHRHANGSEVAHGVYFVRGFRSFENADGTLVGTGLTDGIGELNETTGGVLSLDVRLLPASGGLVHGVLGVHCNLPGSTDNSIKEGVTLSVASLSFVQDTGATLFHVLDH
jgi:hypothetical protein